MTSWSCFSGRRRNSSRRELAGRVRYRKGMAELKKLDLNNPPPVLDEEDEETLAAIDEGVRDAEAGRIVPIEQVRDLLPQWITKSSSPKKR